MAIARADDACAAVEPPEDVVVVASGGRGRAEAARAPHREVKQKKARQAMPEPPRRARLPGFVKWRSPEAEDTVQMWSERRIAEPVGARE